MPPAIPLALAMVAKMAPGISYPRGFGHGGQDGPAIPLGLPMVVKMPPAIPLGLAMVAKTPPAIPLGLSMHRALASNRRKTT